MYRRRPRRDEDAGLRQQTYTHRVHTIHVKLFYFCYVMASVKKQIKSQASQSPNRNDPVA